MRKRKKGCSALRRRGVALVAAALVASTASSGALYAGTGAGHLHSTATNPGTQTHAGVPLHPPQDKSNPPNGTVTDPEDHDACGEFYSHDYKAAFETTSLASKGTVVAFGKTFDTFEVKATWSPAVGSVFYAGPGGTYPDANCVRSTVGYNWGPVYATVVGTNAAGDRLVCEQDGDSGGTFSRNRTGSDQENLEYTMTSHKCEATDADGTPLGTSPDHAVDIDIKAAVVDCSAPITPLLCTSHGRVGSDQGAVFFTNLSAT